VARTRGLTQRKGGARYTRGRPCGGGAPPLRGYHSIVECGFQEGPRQRVGCRAPPIGAGKGRVGRRWERGVPSHQEEWIGRVWLTVVRRMCYVGPWRAHHAATLSAPLCHGGDAPIGRTAVCVVPTVQPPARSGSATVPAQFPHLLHPVPCALASSTAAVHHHRPHRPHVPPRTRPTQTQPGTNAHPRPTSARCSAPSGLQRAFHIVVHTTNHAA
jgi:hypothetical protein